MDERTEIKKKMGDLLDEMYEVGKVAGGREEHIEEEERDPGYWGNTLDMGNLDSTKRGN